MRYWLDCEFNGFGGELISLALVGEKGDSLYLALPCNNPNAWVAQHVLPVIGDGQMPRFVSKETIAEHIHTFFDARDDYNPTIIADWPEDIKHFSEALLTGPGRMVPMKNLTIVMERTASVSKVPHNAYWDAVAMRDKALGDGK